MSSSEVNISRLLILAQKCNNFYLKGEKCSIQYPVFCLEVGCGRDIHILHFYRLVPLFIYISTILFAYSCEYIDLPSRSSLCI